MEIKIGIMHVAREVTIESEASTEEVLTQLQTAISKGESLVLTDAKGRIVAIPAASIGYLDLGGDQVRPVGFGAV